MEFLNFSISQVANNFVPTGALLHESCDIAAAKKYPIMRP